MKYIILFLSLISHNAFSQVNQGEAIKAQDFNAGSSGIGDIRMSILDKTEFQALFGYCWKKMDQAITITGTDLANHTSITTIPNASGLFLRNSGTQTLDGSNIAAGSVGSVQFDGTAPNGMSTDTAGAHNHAQAYDYQWGGRYGSVDTGVATDRAEQAGVFTSKHAALTSTAGNHSHIIEGGQNETRPFNMSMYFYLRVNNDCSQTANQ